MMEPMILRQPRMTSRAHGDAPLVGTGFARAGGDSTYIFPTDVRTASFSFD
jgi:hypothetical protein